MTDLTRAEARTPSSIANPFSLTHFRDDAFRARFEYLAESEWTDHGAKGKWELVCQALHAALMLIGLDNELRDDAELLYAIAEEHRFPSNPFPLHAMA